MKKYVFTCGDINGIGPEIVVKTLNKISKENTPIENSDQFIFNCPINVFNDACNLVNADFKYSVTKKYDKKNSSQIIVIDIGESKLIKGIPTRDSGKIAFASLKLGFKLVKEKKVNAIITAPISKYSLKLAGINSLGHTGLLAKWSKAKNHLMMFLSGNINAALLTIHEPIKNIPKLVNKKKLIDSINLIYQTFNTDMNIENPRIAVLGLNPHAGEDGMIGKEEQKIIIPLIEKLKKKIIIDGPFSADGFFASKKYKDFDCVLGMYHDQVLIPFKMMNFSNGVNYTAGLPIVRTSPDHGTAFDIAWQNKADESSLYEAYRYAKIISANRGTNGKH